MTRKSWVLGTILGIGLVVQASGARADGNIVTLALNDNAAATVPVSWGHWIYGCVNCGTSYYGGHSGYYGAPAYSYGHNYAPVRYFNYSYGYPTGYWGGGYSGYGYSYPYYGNYPYTLSFPGTYGYGIGYPNYQSWGYYQPYTTGYYTAPTYYYPPTTYYYPTATWGVPYAQVQPAVTNVVTTAGVALSYPQANGIIATSPATPVVIPAPTQGFQYDGGPVRPVPMPRNEPQAAPVAPAGVYNIHLTSETNATPSKYAYKAYGEKVDESASSVEKTVLVKGAAR